MPNIPCPDKIDCPCDDSPFANLSSEAPDLPVFIGTYVDRTPVPLGTEWLRAVCQGVCLSTVSQEAADLCAAEAATACVIGSWRSGDPSGASGPPVPPAAGARGVVPNVAVTNTPQSCSVPCPDGLVFTFTVPAGVFAARTQAQADAQAHSYACRQAQLRRVCLSALDSPVCEGEAFAQQITASGKYINVPGKTDLWELVLGTLPDGLDFHGGNLTGGSVLIDGTPTAAGSFTFFVRVTDSKGDVMEKGYTVVIAGVTAPLPDATTGADYSEQIQTIGFTDPVFTLVDGDLPDGLTLSEGGLISGTPTVNQTRSFTVQIAEPGTDFVCNQTVSLKVAGGCGALPTEQFDVPVPAINTTAIAWRSNPPDIGPNNSNLLAVGDISNSVTQIIATVNLDTQEVISVTSMPGFAATCAVYSPVNDLFIFGTANPNILRVTPEPLALISSTDYGLNGTALDGVYNATNGLIYFNWAHRIIVYDPVSDAVVADVPTGDISVSFAGKVSCDEANHLLYIGINDRLNFDNPEGLLGVYDISGDVPFFLNEYVMPWDIGNGTTIENAIFCPANGLVYCHGQNRSGSSFLTRFNPLSRLFQNTQAVAFSSSTLPVFNPTTNLLFLGTEIILGVYCVLSDARIGGLVAGLQAQQGCFVGLGDSSINYALGTSVIQYA